MKILFWNTHKNKNINNYIKNIIIDNAISIVILAEYCANINELLNMLLLEGRNMHQYITSGCERITILGSINDVQPSFQSSYASCQIIQNNYLLCCVHLPSQIYENSNRKREIIISQIIEDICLKEKELNSDNTIVVGDFNMNPYELGCTDAAFFHGIPIYKESIRKSRIIAKQEFKMFYNPMWNFWGDFSPPYGTYYYNGSTSDNIYWHIYDQVLIRPILRERFITESLKIITSAKELSLLDKCGHPNVDISDHLPITFQIKENYHE